MLTENVNSLKAVVKIMMPDLQSVANELNGIKKVIIVSNMITTHNADVSVWGEGTRSPHLENCTLHLSTHEN
jgi:hypothetical protein